MKYWILSAACFGLLAACAPKAAAPNPPAALQAEAQPATQYGAYLIVMGKDYQAKDLGAYAQSLPPVYEKYGGEYVAFSTDMSVMEGRYNYQSLIISGWPSVEAATMFWTSPEYKQSMKLRDGIGTFDVVIIPALKTR